MDLVLTFPRIVLALSLVAVPLRAMAEQPPPLRGFTHTEGSDEDVHGNLLSGAVTISAPVIAETDGNRSNGPEIVVAGSGGRLNVFHADGSLLWTALVPNALCSNVKGTKLMSSPAVGELFGDGLPYVVIGYGALGNLDCDGGVIAFRGTDGSTAWTFSIKQFSKKQHFWAFRYSVVSTPALADVDGDGKLEVGFGSFDRNVYLLNANGKARFYYQAADTVFSSAAFANIDADSNLEMIIGTDISGNKRIRPPTLDGGYVYAFKTKSRKPLRIGFRQRKGYIWQTWFDQVIQSAPIVADVMASSPGQEVVVASGCFFPQKTAKKRGAWIKVLRARDGKVLQTLATPACTSSSPAAADLDGDGILEVIALVNGSKKLGGDGPSRVMAWKADSGQVLWQAEPRGFGANNANGGMYASPVVADLDKNGSLEVIAADVRTVNIFNGIDGRPLTCASSDCSNSLVLDARNTLQNTPAIADINGDGQLDLAIAAKYLFVWTGFEGLLGSDPGKGTFGALPWPQYRGNAARDGWYR